MEFTKGPVRAALEKQTSLSSFATLFRKKGNAFIADVGQRKNLSSLFLQVTRGQYRMGVLKKSGGQINTFFFTLTLL